jgi:hypothetical protein
MNGLEITQLAKEQLSSLTGLKPETVSNVRRDESNWYVQVDMIELSRIPHSTDVLAIYEIQMDDNGNLLGYQRTRRYCRGQVEN